MTFEEAYRKHRTGMLRYAGRWCEDRGIDPEDVVQDAFLIAWRKWSAAGENVFSWLLGIARNAFYHLLRDGLHRTRGGRPTGFAVVEWNADADERQTPATQELTVWLDQLRQKFETLGPSQADALRGVSCGLSVGDIADQTGRTPASVSMALTLGRRRLLTMV